MRGNGNKTNSELCQHCYKPFDCSLAGRRASYCSPKCRVAASRARKRQAAATAPTYSATLTSSRLEHALGEAAAAESKLAAIAVFESLACELGLPVDYSRVTAARDEAQERADRAAQTAAALEQSNESFDWFIEEYVNRSEP